MIIYGLYGKKARITDIDGQVFEGIIFDYESEFDSGYGEAVIDIKLDDSDDFVYELKDSEIVSIEVLE